MGLLSLPKKSKEEKKDPAAHSNVSLSGSVPHHVSTQTEQTTYVISDMAPFTFNNANDSSSANTVQAASRKSTMILVDNGHGVDTPGKRSPDGRLLEYKYTRDVAKDIVVQLKARDYNASLLVTEEKDITIRERIRRVNNLCKKVGATNVLLVSIHCNAAGSDGKWHKARGWQTFVSLNASVRSMTLAENLADAALKYGLKLRKPTPTQKWWQQNLGICRDTNCPAVLTENLFMDNRDDVDFLLSKEGQSIIVNVHVMGIIGYLHSQNVRSRLMLP